VTRTQWLWMQASLALVSDAASRLRSGPRPHSGLFYVERAEAEPLASAPAAADIES
jgi:hypothetical protein